MKFSYILQIIASCLILITNLKCKKISMLGQEINVYDFIKILEVFKILKLIFI